jgi:predicted ATPase
LPAAAARERLVNAVLQIISRVAESQPLLLTIDDVQWADDLSLAVLEGIREEFLHDTRVVVVATVRTDESREALKNLLRRPWVRRIPLDRLGEEDVNRMVGDMLATTRPHLAIVSFVHTQAEGIPFFVAEYLRAMVTDGLLARTDGWRGRRSRIAWSRSRGRRRSSGLARRGCCHRVGMNRAGSFKKSRVTTTCSSSPYATSEMGT